MIFMFLQIVVQRQVIGELSHLQRIVVFMIYLSMKPLKMILKLEFVGITLMRLEPITGPTKQDQVVEQ